MSPHPRLRSSPSLPNIWIPPRQPAMDLPSPTGKRPSAPPSPTPSPRHVKYESFDPPRPTKSHVRRRTDRDQPSSLITPPLTPSSSIQTTASIQSTLDTSVEEAPLDHKPCTHEIFDTHPDATRVLMLGNAHRELTIEALVSPICEAAAKLPDACQEPHVKAINSLRKSEGLIPIIFFDIRVAKQVKDMLLAEDLSFRRSFIQESSDHSFFVQSITADELVEKFKLRKPDFSDTIDNPFLLKITPEQPLPSGLQHPHPRAYIRSEQLYQLHRLITAFGSVRFFNFVREEVNADQTTSLVYRLEYHDSRVGDEAHAGLDSRQCFGLSLQALGKPNSQPEPIPLGPAPRFQPNDPQPCAIPPSPRFFYNSQVPHGIQESYVPNMFPPPPERYWEPDPFAGEPNNFFPNGYHCPPPLPIVGHHPPYPFMPPPFTMSPPPPTPGPMFYMSPILPGANPGFCPPPTPSMNFDFDPHAHGPGTFHPQPFLRIGPLGVPHWNDDLPLQRVEPINGNGTDTTSPVPPPPIPSSPSSDRDHDLLDNHKHSSGKRPAPTPLDLWKIESGADTRTTVMIKNIPNKMSDVGLMEFIDSVVPKSYDFFYLRIDFRNGCNVGYGFVNFINVEDLLTFAKAKLGVKWGMFSSDKVLQMSYAIYQGKEAAIEKFRNSSVMDEKEGWRPKVFHSSGAQKGMLQPFPAPTHIGRKERSSANRGALFVPGVMRGLHSGGGVGGRRYQGQSERERERERDRERGFSRTR